MTETPDLQRTDGSAARRQAFRDGLVFRVVACVFLEVVVFATALPSGLSLASFWRPVAVVALIGALDAPYWYVGKARDFPMWHFYVHWGVDLVAISVLIYDLGGLKVPYGPFIYSMIVITSATFMSRMGAYLVATGAAVCVVAMAVGIRLELLPAPIAIWRDHAAWTGDVTVVVGAIIFFFMNGYLAGTLSDQLKVAHKQIEDHAAVLEDRVHERTRLLEARTLELHEQTGELQELVYAVTHDLQNVAVASAENARKLIDLEGETASGRPRRYLDRLRRDSALMATMLRDLLDAVSQSKVAERRQRVDVAATVRDVLTRVQPVVESKGIAVTVGALPQLVADDQKIHRVFENLLTNACKYVGDKADPRIEIGGSVENGSIEYFVRDNGIGIEPTQTERIFQLYHRAPAQTVAGVVQQGQGIGLAVAKRIVQRYGGRLWVESVPGEGSTFRLSFPREKAIASSKDDGRPQPSA